LEQRISELRTQATEAFQTVQDFKSQNRLIVSGDGQLATDVELEQLTELLAKARAETVRAHSRLADIEAVLSTQRGDDALPEGTVADALSSPVITDLRQQYFDDNKRAIEWASRYGPNHQTVVDLRSGMANLKREIREEIQRIAETYKSDLKVARSREETIEKRVTEVFQNNSENRQSQVKLRELETAANTYRSTYANFLSRYTQAVQQQSFPSAEARIITFASIGKKSSPTIALDLALAIVGGLAFGAAAALLKQRTDRIIYARDQLIGERGVTCLAILSIPERPNRVLSSRAKSELRTIVLPKWIFAKQMKAESPRLLYNEAEPFSTTSEALRDIKVAIDHRSNSHETLTLAIVSALPGEGKSSVAASLAATIAKAGRKVLMIDRGPIYVLDPVGKVC
jgi:succinoglycan biosynthesis transport protein ExoP